MIICEDADRKCMILFRQDPRHRKIFVVDFAVFVAHEAIFHNAAQNCIAASRTFVHSKIYDQFIEKSVALAKMRVVGDPFDDNTQQGPQVNRYWNLVMH